MTITINGMDKDEYYAKGKAEGATQHKVKNFPKKRLITFLVLCVFDIITYFKRNEQAPITGIDIWIFIMIIAFVSVPYQIYFLVYLLVRAYKSHFWKRKHAIFTRRKLIIAGTLVLGASIVIALTKFDIIIKTKNNYISGTSRCNANYEGACVPNVNHDIDCSTVRHRVRVVGKDVYHLDGDHNGVGCESYY